MRQESACANRMRRLLRIPVNSFRICFADINRRSCGQPAICSWIAIWIRGLVVRLKKMAARTNRQMLELLGGDREFHKPNSEPVPESLVNELGEGFKEVDWCVVPSSFQAAFIWSEARPRVNNVDDETGFECSLSKVRRNDFVDSSVSLSELARIG